MVSKLCIDATSDAAMQKAALDNLGTSCSKRDIVRGGSTITIDSICTIGQRTVTTHMTMRFDGDATYHNEIQSHFEPPIVTGRPDSVAIQDGKWAGPCPADMEPGDMIMPNGTKINVLGAMTGGK